MSTASPAKIRVFACLRERYDPSQAVTGTVDTGKGRAATMRARKALAMQEAGMTYTEIAAALGVSRNSVLHILRRAKAARAGDGDQAPQ